MDEDTANLLLPYLVAGLGPEALLDYQSATLMIIGQLAARATLGADLVAGVGLALRSGGVCGAMGGAARLFTAVQFSSAGNMGCPCSVDHASARG